MLVFFLNVVCYNRAFISLVLESNYLAGQIAQRNRVEAEFWSVEKDLWIGPFSS